MAATATKRGLWQRIVDWGLGLLDDEPDQRSPATPATPRHKLPQRSNATIDRVRQVDDTSCGVAAAAMFARQTHDVVKAFMFPGPRRQFRTRYLDVWRALSHFGVEHEEKRRKFRGWDEIPSHALVRIRWKGVPERNAYHWVIFQRLPKGFRVIDPGSWGNTLTDIDLDAFDALSYSLATPRTREQGPAKVPVRQQAAKPRLTPAKKGAARNSKSKVS